RTDGLDNPDFNIRLDWSSCKRPNSHSHAPSEKQLHKDHGGYHSQPHPPSQRNATRNKGNETSHHLSRRQPNCDIHILRPLDDRIIHPYVFIARIWRTVDKPDTPRCNTAEQSANPEP